MTKKRQLVFQLITSINLGGAENVAFNLSEKCGNNTSNLTEFVIIELYRSNTNYANEKRIDLKEKNIKTYSLFNGKKLFSLFVAPFVLMRVIKKEKPDIIHSHTDLPDFVLASTIFLLRMFKICIPKIVRTIHNTELWPTYPRIAKYTESAFYDDVIVGVSKAALQAYYNIRIDNKLEVSNLNRVIYNGCNLPIKTNIEIAFVSNKINIAFCGRFEYQKGIDVLSNRIKSINKIYNNSFNFYLIGHGQLKDEVNNLAKQFDNVFIYEAIPSISNKLHNFDFIIMPSRFEGLPLISIEASFSKVPVIASKAPGLIETLPQSWPLWFDLDNEEELLAIFKKIVNKEFNIKKIKEEAFDFVYHNFSMEYMIQEYNKIYAGILIKV